MITVVVIDDDFFFENKLSLLRVIASDSLLEGQNNPKKYSLAVAVVFTSRCNATCYLGFFRERGKMGQTKCASGSDFMEMGPTK